MREWAGGRLRHSGAKDATQCRGELTDSLAVMLPQAGVERWRQRNVVPCSQVSVNVGGADGVSWG